MWRSRIRHGWEVDAGVNGVAISIVFALSGVSMIWALWMLANWLYHGRPDRYPYKEEFQRPILVIEKDANGLELRSYVLEPGEKTSDKNPYKPPIWTWW